jgi:hypothetical protein
MNATQTGSQIYLQNTVQICLLIDPPRTGTFVQVLLVHCKVGKLVVAQETPEDAIKKGTRCKLRQLSPTCQT